jgi:sulfur relay (sulfurtransferase) complex TusBCD TusD component (DsrE family)
MKVLVIRQGPACGDERAEDQLTAPAHRSTLEDLADWVLWADNTVTF